MAYTRHGHHIQGSSRSDVGFVGHDPRCTATDICSGCIVDIQFWKSQGTVQISDVRRIQELEDRATNSMTPTEVPSELADRASAIMHQWSKHYDSSVGMLVRHILSDVLPIHERMVREKIAGER